MKPALLLLAVLLMGGCAKLPTQDMKEGEAMFLMKPLSSTYGYRDEVIRLRLELVRHNGQVKPNVLHTVGIFPAAENASSQYECKINGQSARTHSSNETTRAGSCYLPVLAYVNDGSIAEQNARYYEVVNGARYNHWGNKWCGFELKEVDCGWLKTEAESLSIRLKTPPVFITNN